MAKAFKKAPLDLDRWLESHGFDKNPFHSGATRAEKDDVLKANEAAFVRVPYYESIKGTPENEGHHFIIGESGSGKTTVCNEIKRYYDDLLGIEDQPQVLVVIYNSFEDLPSESQGKEDYRQALLRAHGERIIMAILLRLFEIWSNDRKSARIERINNIKIKKRLQWYLTKYLNLFPWQFERLKKKVKLRSYLPIVHYLMRVLLGALASWLPTTAPLTAALGNIPTYERYSEMEGKYSTRDLLSELIDLCKRVGYKSVYVLIDDIDIGFSESEKHEKGFWRIAPLFLHHEIYDIEGLILKIFIPQGMEQFYRKEVRPDRMLHVRMEWTKELIEDVYRRRLRICQRLSNDQEQPSLANLCGYSLRDKIDNFMVEYAAETKTPRALIELGVHLLTEHFYAGERYTDELISEETWKRALEKARGNAR